MEPNPHYHGAAVRKLFIIAGLVMLITLPFFKNNLSTSVFNFLILILALTFFAGMTNPKYRQIIIGDVIVSAVGFSIFAYQAITTFVGFFNLFFVINIILSLVFLFAFYWSVRTIRAFEFSKVVIQKVIARTKRKREKFINLEDAPPGREVPHHTEITEEERRKKRFLQGDE